MYNLSKLYEYVGIDKQVEVENVPYELLQSCLDIIAECRTIQYSHDKSSYYPYGFSYNHLLVLGETYEEAVLKFIEYLFKENAITEEMKEELFYPLSYMEGYGG